MTRNILSFKLVNQNGRNYPIHLCYPCLSSSCAPSDFASGLVAIHFLFFSLLLRVGKHKKLLKRLFELFI